MRAKSLCCRILAPAQPVYQAASVRDFLSGAYTAARYQRFQRLRLPVLKRPNFGFNRFVKTRQNLGVEPVGLGQPPGGAGKLSDLPRVNHRDRNSRTRQRSSNGRFQTAGCIQDHQLDSELEPLEQIPDSVLVVGIRKALSVWPNSHVQLCLGYDKPLCLLHHRISSGGSDLGKAFAVVDALVPGQTAVYTDCRSTSASGNWVFFLRGESVRLRVKAIRINRLASSSNQLESRSAAQK